MKNFSSFILILGVILFFDTRISSQELVPDPSMEILKPEYIGNVVCNFVETLEHWYEVNGTPDSHHQDYSGGINLCQIQPCPLGQGNATCGYPVDGKAIIKTFKANGAAGVREWAGTRLVEPMVVGDCYTVSFYVQNKKDDPDRLLALSNWGVYFSTTDFPFFSPDAYDYSNDQDHIVVTEELIQDTLWHYVEKDFIATEPFEYLYLGFQDNYAKALKSIYNDNNMLGPTAWFDLVSVTKQEEITLEVPEDITLCVGDSTDISITSNQEVITTDGINQYDEKTFNVRPGIGITTFYVTTQDSTPCMKIDSFDITVIDTSNIEFTISPTESCVPLDVIVTQTNGQMLSGDDYTYDFGDGTAIKGGSSQGHSYTTSGVYIPTIIMEFGPRCTYEYIHNEALNAIEKPIASFTVDPENPTTLDPALLSDNSSGTGDSTMYEWVLDDSISFYGDFITLAFFVPGEYTIGYIVTNDGVCADTISRVIKVKPDIRIYLPNAFSPNGDANNDVYQANIVGSFTTFNMKIYNRWGDKVFESFHPSITWDGRYNGEPCAEGVYTVRLQYSFQELIESSSETTNTLFQDLQLLR